MGGRLRALILVGALVGVGVLAGSAVSQWWEVPGARAAVDVVRTATAPRERVRVEVLNAAGRPNLARAATDALRKDGFDVVYFGNADRFDRDRSVVLDRVGDLAHARAVADALGIREVRSEPDENRFVDVSVLLGGAWALPPEPVVDTLSVARPWWDLRRFLPSEAPPSPRPEGEQRAGSMANPSVTGEDR